VHFIAANNSRRPALQPGHPAHVPGDGEQPARRCPAARPCAAGI